MCPLPKTKVHSVVCYVSCCWGGAGDGAVDCCSCSCCATSSHSPNKTHPVPALVPALVPVLLEPRLCVCVVVVVNVVVVGGGG